MGKNLLSRREVMIICKSIFDFKKNGIKPLSKDIKLCNGWRFLEYYFYDDLGDEYYVKFYIKESKKVSFYLYKCIDHDTFVGVYTEMTRDEISKIANRGGDDKVKLDRMVSDFLHSLDLSNKAQNVIANTDINAMAESFGGLFTKKDVENFIEEYYD